MRLSKPVNFRPAGAESAGNFAVFTDLRSDLSKQRLSGATRCHKSDINSSHGGDRAEILIDETTSREIWAQVKASKLIHGAPATKTLRSIYLDTPDHVLMRLVSP